MPSDYPSGPLAYRDLELAFLTFYKRNQRLKNSLSWRITLPIRRVDHYLNLWRAFRARWVVAARNVRALCFQSQKTDPAAIWRNLLLNARAPGRVELAYHRWRQAHPLPRLNDDEVVPRRLLVLLGTEALHSPHLTACQASLRQQRGCQVEIIPLSAAPVLAPGAYDAVLWLRMAVTLAPDYGQLACRALIKDKTLFYADHDTRLSAVLHERPFFKPAFSPELLGQVDYLAAGCALSSDWLARQNALHIDGVTDVLLHAALRRLSQSEVAHLPLCLSHLPASAPARLIPPESTPSHAAMSEIHSTPRITIIIPTAFRGSYLRTLLQSLHSTTKAYSHVLEVVIITCDPPAQGDELLKGAPLPFRLLHHDQDFNYATVNNAAVLQTDSEILIFLNDDIELHDKHWLPDMLALLQRPHSGVVGSLLLYPDNTIQHAGCLIGMNGGVGHIGIGLRGDTQAYHGVVTAQREISAVTGACMAIRRDVFVQAGMFDENLPFSFNDVALCLRLRDLGYTHYITTRSRITHHESRSRGYDDTPRKYQMNREYFLYARSHYPGLREEDPYYSPNLDLSQPYLAYAHISTGRLALALRPATPGCLILLAQRTDYDPTTAPLLKSLKKAGAAGPVRVMIAAGTETRFSSRCRAALPPGTVTIAPLTTLRNALLNATNDIRVLDLRLLELIEGMTSPLPLLGLAFQDGQPCLIDLFGRRAYQHQADGRPLMDIASLFKGASHP